MWASPSTSMLSSGLSSGRWLRGTPYHLILNRTTLGGTALSFNGTQATNYVANTLPGHASACDHLGVVNINAFNAAVQGLITGGLAGLINTGTFPVFLTRNVVQADGGHSFFANCCIL